jgi:mono/diheme cytochrome c family protein
MILQPTANNRIGNLAIVLLYLFAFARPAAANGADLQNVGVDQLQILDVAGTIHELGDTDGLAGTVFVFISSECPISRKYVPELNRLSDAAAEKRLAFYAVLSDASISRVDAAKFIDEFSVSFPVLFDTSGDLAETFQPTHVPEAFVIRPQGQLVYRGRIDDLYADVDKKRIQASQRDLLAAIISVAAGKEVPVARTKAVGCKFESFASAADQEVTYARQIAPILQANCAECHRPGEVAPFSLLTHEDAAKRSEWIRDITASKLMPPWKAEAGHGHFVGSRRLSDRQIQQLAAWHEAGAPKGREADLPPAPEFAAGWRMGEPDLVLTAPDVYPVPADGPDVFQHFWVPIDIDEDKVVVGWEFRPGNPAVVHHAVIFLDAFQGSRKRDAETPEPGWTSSGSVDGSISGFFGVWTPGFTPRKFPNGAGIQIEKGSDMVFQLHLNPSGKKETDQSRIGLYFADKPVETKLSSDPVVLGSIAIDVPPGEKRHRVSSTVELAADMKIFSTFPHMHLIAKEMKVTATKPDGETESLIWIKDWNFYWQDSYVYREPLELPAGTKIELNAYYDNSADNPFNTSDPLKPVRFGNNSSDEMCFLILQTIDEDPIAASANRNAIIGGLMRDITQADLSVEARTDIKAEAMKLFGSGGRR